MNRWEIEDREIANSGSRGFSFEKRTTRAVKGCEESTGHYRVVCYVSHFVDVVVIAEGQLLGRRI